MTTTFNPVVSRISFPPDNKHLRALSPLLLDHAWTALDAGIATTPLTQRTPSLQANAYYFGYPPWAYKWLHHVHRYPQLRERWHALGGSWDGKDVIDIGCGPGNLFATLGGRPRVLIGVDISRGALRYAAELGYTPLRADASNLPLRSACADIVSLNAVLHCCDDMAQVLAESARLVRPGGILITDHDPQASAYKFRGLARSVWNARKPLYHWLRSHGAPPEFDEWKWETASEVHYKPGDGISESLVRNVLEPLGFDVQVFPHNNTVGKEILDGHRGRASRRIRLLQRLSGIDPNSPQGAITLLVLARKRL